MKIQCGYCGSFISDTDERCPNCGAVNENLMRSAEGIPKTVEELKAFCAERALPLEKMRFFIGEDYRQPKAFGIFKNENGDFVVYKNKADGSRAVRYQGKDEAYAVNEIYQKMKSEILQRKSADAMKNAGSIPSAPEPVYAEKTAKRKRGCLMACGSFFIIPVLFIIVMSIAVEIYTSIMPDRGYYTYNGGYYYYQSEKWYSYDEDSGEWHSAYNIDRELKKHHDDYYKGYDYYDDYGATEFSGSFGSGGYHSYDDSYDNSYDDWNDNWDDRDDWSYDYDRWDYDDSDWDSDW